MDEHEIVPETAQTRREFIRNIGKKTLYAVPLIVSFARADLSSASPHGSGVGSSGNKHGS